jgi:hypothetical protein
MNTNSNTSSGLNPSRDDNVRDSEIRTPAANGDDVAVRWRWLPGQARRIWRSVLNNEASFVVYVKLLLGKRVVSAATSIAAALTAIDAFRGSHDQLLLSARWWLIVTVLGVMLAQFLVWQDFWRDEVEPRHGEDLRELAKKLRRQLHAGIVPTYTDGALAAWTAPHIFGTHFPDIAKTLKAYEQETHNVETARATLVDTVITKGAERVFGRTEGWSPKAIAKRSKTHLDSILKGEKQALGLTQGVVSWLGDPVLDPAYASTPVEVPSDALALLEDWLDGVSRSPKADAYRSGVEARAAMTLRGLALLDPLLYEEPIRKVPGCQICFPPKGSRLRPARRAPRSTSDSTKNEAQIP